MGSDKLSVGAECDIDQRLLFQQVVKHREQSGPVVVPLEAELLFGSHDDDVTSSVSWFLWLSGSPEYSFST